MIRQLVKLSCDNKIPINRPDVEIANAILTAHPIQLTQLLEAAWEGRANRMNKSSAILGEYLSYLNSKCTSVAGVPNPQMFPRVDYDADPIKGTILWDHLIYAFCLENTGIYEIFRRVVYEFLHGEKLEVPSPEGQAWLRNTEELFFRDTPPFSIFNMVSTIRPDQRASRRNAYYRMFGMDLNFGLDDSRPYPYEKPRAANRDFIATLEELLREVWRGIINFQNKSGENLTDDEAILTLCKRLHNMLTSRRINGNLAREEFWYVTTMSWFHQTIEFDSPIVVDLKGCASGAEERLKKIGERVGLPPHRKSENFFELADSLSYLLTAIERGDFMTITNIKELYKNDPTNPICARVMNIITHYSVATGRDIKAKGITVTSKAR